MRARISSIFSSNHPAIALLTFAAVVLCCEVFFDRKSTRYHVHHEVDTLVDQIDRGDLAAPVIAIGSSVGRQLFRRDLPEAPVPYVMAAANGALSSIGQSLLVERYLDVVSEPALRGVAYAAANYDMRLNMRSENYLLRVFTKPRDVLAVWEANHDPSLSALHLAYALLPSFRARFGLQERLGGITNTDPRVDGAFEAKPNTHASSSSVLGMLKDRLADHNTYEERALRRLFDVTKARGIEVLMIPAPRIGDVPNRERRPSAGASDVVDKLVAEYPNVRQVETMLVMPPPDFVDSIHLTPDALEYARADMAPAFHEFLLSHSN